MFIFLCHYGKILANGNSVFCPHLIQGVYNKNINQGITNTNFYPIYNPNGMAYSWEQFNVFAGYDRTDLMNEYKQRQLTSFAQQYASDNARGTFNQVVRYYQSKFGCRVTIDVRPFIYKKCDKSSKM